MWIACTGEKAASKRCRTSLLFAFLFAAGAGFAGPFPGHAAALQDANPGEAALAEPAVAKSPSELMEEFGLDEKGLDEVLRIIDEGKNRSQVVDHLRHLTQEIGPRLTASSRLETANNWVADQFRSFGLQNVRLHQWGEFPVRFDRGPCSGKMVEPEEREFQFTAQAWSAGTKGPVRGPVVREPATVEELEAMQDRLEGAWILRRPGSSLREPPRRREPEADSPLLSRLRAAGIAGMITASRDELVRTGGIPGIRQMKFEELPQNVTVIVRRSDYDAINSRLADGENVVVEFNLDHQFTPGPIPVYNTIGEIPGTEFPDQVVIISAHLDSWDGPGSQGTVDNGTGSSVTIEAARILAACGIKPRRTIRFALWSGEEQGLLGSKGYVAGLSEEERANISAVIVDDSGTNREASLDCVACMEPMLRRAIAPMNYAFPDVPIVLNVRDRMPRMGASDHASFQEVGIPGFFWGKSGRADYRYAWHTQNDRFEQGIPEYLIKNATVSAIAAYMLAQADTLLPRPAPSDEPPAEEARGGGDGERRRPNRDAGRNESGSSAPAANAPAGGSSGGSGG